MKEACRILVEKTQKILGYRMFEQIYYTDVMPLVICCVRVFDSFCFRQRFDATFVWLWPSCLDHSTVLGTEIIGLVRDQR